MKAIVILFGMFLAAVFIFGMNFFIGAVTFLLSLGLVPYAIKNEKRVYGWKMGLGAAQAIIALGVVIWIIGHSPYRDGGDVTWRFNEFPYILLLLESVAAALLGSFNLITGFLYHNRTRYGESPQ